MYIGVCVCVCVLVCVCVALGRACVALGRLYVCVRVWVCAQPYSPRNRINIHKCIMYSLLISIEYISIDIYRKRESARASGREKKKEAYVLNPIYMYICLYVYV